MDLGTLLSRRLPQTRIEVQISSEIETNLTLMADNRGIVSRRSTATRNSGRQRIEILTFFGHARLPEATCWLLLWIGSLDWLRRFLFYTSPLSQEIILSSACDSISLRCGLSWLKRLYYPSDIVIFGPESIENGIVGVLVHLRCATQNP
jgi:hypothetical protein